MCCLLEVLGKIIHPTERKRHEGIKGFRVSLSAYGQCVPEWRRRVGRAQPITSLTFLALSRTEDPVLVLCSAPAPEQAACLVQLCPLSSDLKHTDPPFCTTASPSIKGVSKNSKSFSGLLEKLGELKQLSQSDYSWHIVNAQ